MPQDTYYVRERPISYTSQPLLEAPNNEEICLRNLVNSGYISKLALFTIMLKIAEEIERLSAEAPFFVTPDNVLVIGFEELNPENIRVRFIWELCQECLPVYKAP